MISLPAMGMLLIEDPITYPSATGITWVTPSPESITVPVSDLSVTFDDVHEAARANTACTAIYNPAQLKDSKKISAVFSRFSGGFNGYSKSAHDHGRGMIHAYGLSQQEVMVLGFHSQILED